MTEAQTIKKTSDDLTDVSVAENKPTETKPSNNIKYGDTGNTDLRLYQTKLGIKSDGVYGDQTNNAVRKFQTDNGLVVDGIIGKNTRAAFDKFNQDKTSPTISDPSVATADLAGESVAKTKGELNKHLMDKQNQIDTGVDKIEVSNDKADLKEFGSTDDLTDVPNPTVKEGEETNPEFKEKELENSVTKIAEKESYSAAVETLISNDEMYKNFANEYNAAAERFAESDYKDNTTVKALLLEKKKGLEEVKQFNDRVEKIATTSQYHTGGFKYQSSASEDYLHEQIKANKEIFDKAEGKYDLKVMKAIDKMRKQDEEAMDEAWKNARMIKKDMGDLLKTEHAMQMDVNKEQRANIKLTMDKGMYQMKTRDIQAKQLGAILAANPGADIKTIISDNNWSSLDKGGLALANSYARKERLDNQLQRSRISSANRANRPEDNGASKLNAMTKFYMSKAGGGMNPIAAEQSAKNYINSAKSDKKQIKKYSPEEINTFKKSKDWNNAKVRAKVSLMDNFSESNAKDVNTGIKEVLGEALDNYDNLEMKGLSKKDYTSYVRDQLKHKFSFSTDSEKKVFDSVLNKLEDRLMDDRVTGDKELTGTRFDQSIREGFSSIVTNLTGVNDLEDDIDEIYEKARKDVTITDNDIVDYLEK